MPEGVPEPPPKLPFPSDDLAKAVEQSYVEKRRIRMQALRIVASAETNQFIAADLQLFERKDVLTKTYPPSDHVIICEGDSWFNHPFLEDIPEELLYFGYSVLHSNYPGKHLGASLREHKFLAPLLDQWKPQIKALLLSGGGNDLINWHKGDADFSPIFRRAPAGSSPSDFIDAANLRQALQELVGYLNRHLGCADKSKCEGTAGPLALLRFYIAKSLRAVPI